MKIVDDTVYVLGRDQITRLHDLNGDGEADFYESFNNECKVTPDNGHAYTTCLETDAEGNFYYCKCGDSTKHGGTVLRVDKYGRNLEVFATGIRNPNGLGGGPNGLITEADNEGEWVPASRIDVVKKGRFLGFTPMSHTDKPPTDPGKPIVWMPQDVDNSSGGQTWVVGNRWGLPDGDMLHTSYGAAALLHVMTEDVDGITQGAVWRFPFRFGSGIVRPASAPADGPALCLADFAAGRRRASRMGRSSASAIPASPCISPPPFTSAPTASSSPSPARSTRRPPPMPIRGASSSGITSGHQPTDRGCIRCGIRLQQGYDQLEVKSATLSWPMAVPSS